VPVPGEIVKERGSYFVSGHNGVPLQFYRGESLAGDRSRCRKKEI
jgi:hypothetical protein